MKTTNSTSQTSPFSQTPIAITIAGVDSSGGAGVAADLKTFSALGVYGACAIAALTAQNTCGVAAVLPITPDFVRQQIDVTARDLNIHAVKIGMLGDGEIIQAVADSLHANALKNIVLDPVMVAKSGDALLNPSAISALCQHLLPLADIITPNLPEAAVLLGQKEPISAPEQMPKIAQQLIDLGARAVLLKGGHLHTAQSDDFYLNNQGASQWLPSPRHAQKNTHGTGCTLSSAIAAFLARGQSQQDAVLHAKQYISAAIKAADDLHIGSGIGPVHHFYHWWRCERD